MKDYSKIPLGCLPSKMDPRNYTLAKIGVHPLRAGDLPKEYPGGRTPEHWRKFLPPDVPGKSYDQGYTSMCVAFSGSLGKSISEHR